MMAIQSGPPSAVLNLKAVYNSASITISWIAPFSLDVTDIDPDIWYSVYISIEGDDKNITSILCTGCISIPNTQYTWTPENLNPHQKYLFSVISFNEAGQGNYSATVTVSEFLSIIYKVLYIFLLYIEMPTLTRSDVKAVCDGVNITFEVDVRNFYVS